MSASDAVTETFDEEQKGFAGRLASLAETFGPTLARQAESGNLAAASGVVSLVRAGRTLLKGDRKRGVVQALGGMFLLGVALAQRRSGSSAGVATSGHSTPEDDLSEVADTSPDVADAVEPGDRETDHATGEEVVNTTDADIEESDTAPEVESDVNTRGVDQRDVTDSTDLADAVESDQSASETETEARADEESAEGDD